MTRTRATRALDDAGVDYTVTDYEPGEGGFGAALVEATGLDPARAGKTLVADLDDGRVAVAIVPVDGSLDLKALGRALGAKRARMAVEADAERVTGYVVGGISPFGLRSALPIVIDAALADGDVIHVSGGQRGVEVTVAPDDLIAVTGARVAPLTRP